MLQVSDGVAVVAELMGYEGPPAYLRGWIHLLRLPEEDTAASWGLNSACTCYVEEFRTSPDLLEDALVSKGTQRLQQKKTRCCAATFRNME